MKLSIIIPTLNEEAVIGDTLSSLVSRRNKDIEIVISDGGSADRTVALCHTVTDVIVQGPQGRARQMNRGAAAASGDVLLFLHADTRLPDDFISAIEHALLADDTVWGYFDISLSGQRRSFRIIEGMINLRTAITAIASGDQALFVTRQVFEKLGGYPDIKLMEDIAFSRQLKRLSRPARIRQRATTSSRRWQENGIARTVLLMWYLRLAYYCGVDPDRLWQRYK